MKRCQLTVLSTVVITMVGSLASSTPVQGESPGYQSPSFYGATQMGGGPNRSAPPYPASPLAGGASAARGDSFMDARGQPIVMQAGYSQGCNGGGGYCESCPGGMGGMGGGMGGGYGDPMAVDFGGYSQPDQCGPHYFDVAIETVFLKTEDLVGEGLLPFSSEGVGGAPPPPNTVNPRLDPRGESEDYEAGWQIAVRYDLGPLSVIEATYMGLYDIGFDLSARSIADNDLFSIFSQYGIAPDPVDGVAGIAGIDGVDEHQLTYQSDLQSTEISYRRYWVGHNPRISGTLLAGARYVRMTEDFIFAASQIDALGRKTLTGGADWSSENDLVGFQMGADGWACMRQGLRLGVEGKAGVYNNRFKFDANNNASIAPVNPQLPGEGNQVAFVAEGGISFVADLLPSWSLKGGYEVFYINSVVSLQDNVATTQYFAGNAAAPDPQRLAPVLNSQGSLLYHGFHGGVEYVW